MSGISVYPVTSAAPGITHINNDQYLATYQQSITDPETF